MHDPSRKNQKLIDENHALKQKIKELEQSEAERKRAEEKFRLLVMNSSDITGIVDPDGKQRYISDTAERITGFPASELASKNISEVIHPDDLLRILEAFQGCLAHPDKLLRAEYRHIHKTKGWVYVEAIGQNFIDDPNIRGVITNVRDITNRKKAEEALKLSEITYREIFNTVNDAIWVHDIETGEFLDVNNAVTEIFGYSVNEAMNLNIEDISSGVPPYTQETAVELFRKAIDGEPQLFEWHCKHKDGHLFWTEVNLRRGSIAGKERILALERDITERKRAEEWLRRAHDKLEQLVAERTEELRQANEKLLTDIIDRKRAEEALEEERRRLQQTLDEVRTLRGIVPICANCKKIRDDKGFWNQVEKYVSEHTEAEFSHGICPDCTKKLYPDIYIEKKMKDMERSVVLLVDDEADFRMIFIRKIKHILKDQEFEFIEASDGAEALELLKGGTKPSIIILDYAMPKINGVELLRRIDSDHNDLHDVPRIMISGYAQDEIISEAVRLRCVFFEKSVDNIFYQQICQYMTNTLVDLAHKKRGV
jgi:PAS domain S-box-containing protein